MKKMITIILILSDIISENNVTINYIAKIETNKEKTDI